MMVRGRPARGHGRPSVAAALRRGVLNAGRCACWPGVWLMNQRVSGCRGVALHTAAGPPRGLGRLAPWSGRGGSRAGVARWCRIQWPSFEGAVLMGGGLAAHLCPLAARCWLREGGGMGRVRVVWRA